MSERVYVAARRWLRWSQEQLGHEAHPMHFPEMAPQLDISFLGQKPEHFETVANWLYREWSEPRGETLIVRRQQLRRQLNTARLPVALVAIWDGSPAGTVSLRATDLRTRPRATPWLSALYVDPAYRSKGIGRALVQATESLAVWFGYRHLHLFTADRQSLYAELGWTQLPRSPEEQRHQPPSDVFVKDLKP